MTGLVYAPFILYNTLYDIYSPVCVIPRFRKGKLLARNALFSIGKL